MNVKFRAILVHEGRNIANVEQELVLSDNQPSSVRNELEEWSKSCVCLTYDIIPDPAEEK